MSRILAGNKAERWEKFFILSAGCILLVTGLAKVISASGKAAILENTDPLFGISFRHLMLLAGITELVVSGACFLRAKRNHSLNLVTWLATAFLVYRAGLWYIGWRRPCPCMGYVTDALHIHSQTADTIMKIILAYLLFGGYGTLLLFSVRNMKRSLT